VLEEDYGLAYEPSPTLISDKVIDLAPQFDVQGKFVQRHVGLARLELEKGGFEYGDRPVKSGRSGGPLDPLDVPACTVAQRGESDDLESQAPAMGILEGSRSGAGTAGSMCTLHANSSAEVFNKIALLAAQAPERLEFRHAFALAKVA
jgi:hypothetical protein